MAILADTSAWVEFLRGTGSDVDRRMDALTRDRTVLVTEPVLMELLAGTRDRDEWQEVRRMASAFDFASVEGPSDWVDAAALARRMRLVSRSVASVVDCLVAVVAMRVGVPLLHADADFDAIAEHTPLQIA